MRNHRVALIIFGGLLPALVAAGMVNTSWSTASDVSHSGPAAMATHLNAVIITVPFLVLGLLIMATYHSGRGLVPPEGETVSIEQA